MSIGDGPDIPSYDKEREKEVNLGDEVNTWWYNLEYDKRAEIIRGWLGDKGFDDPDEEWEELPWSEQLEIFNEEKG